MSRECDTCGDTICEHGFCDCSEESCPYCRRRRELEAQAEREANYQRDVIGPLFGFEEEQ